MFTPTIVFLTALPLEFKAVIEHFPELVWDSQTIGNRKYTVGQYRQWRVVVRQQQSQGNYQAARETEWLIQHFNPAYLFFVGVAGGIKDVKLGDVVVATLAKGYESVKVKDGVTYPRLHVEYSSKNLVEQAFELARNWQPKTHVCAIASGEKLVSDEAFLKDLKQLCSDAVAVEMEAIGFLGSISQREGMVKGIVIRGISDLIVGKNLDDDKIWQPTAAKNAAAFAWAMLESLSLPTELPMAPSLDTGVFYVPRPRTDYFTGREEILQQAQALLAKPIVVAFCGLGGMGKTQTAVEYAHRHRGEYQAVLWVSGETPENLSMGLLTLAQELSLPVAGKSPAEVRLLLEHWLQTQRGWLLLIDNVDDLTIVKDFLNKIKTHGHILLTTRAAVTRPLAEPLEVDKMTEAEGVAFLYKRVTGSSKPDATEPDARALVRLLGGLPLALDQAGAYLAGGKSFRRYIEVYQTHGLELLEERGLLAHDEDHPDPVAVTWLLSFEKVNSHNPLAVQILQQCAFLAAEGIVQEVFADLDALAYDKAIDEILKYSLLKRDDKVGLLFMHRLVQTVLQAQWNEEDQKQIVEQVIRLLVKACPDEENFENYIAWIKRSGEWLWNARSGQQWIEKWQLQSAEVGRLLNQMGYYLEKIGDYAQALPLSEEALTIREQVLGKQHPAYATSLNNLAALYKSQGQFEKALPLYEEASKIFGQVLGKQHPDYATSLNNLAGLYESQGQFEKALPLYEEALTIREQVLGKQHPDYATSLNNLAGLYDSQGQFEKALPLYEESSKILGQVLGKQHPDYATSLNNLAALYDSQGHFEKALPLLEEALTIKEQVLGKQHPNYANSLNNLAELYRTQGQFEKALPLSEEASKIWGQVLGKQHPAYATSLNNLAGLYKSQGQFEKALPLYEEASKIFGQVLGKQHPDYATSLNNLAGVYYSQGQFEKALPLYEEALQISTRALGEKHPDTQARKRNYEICRARVSKRWWQFWK